MGHLPSATTRGQTVPLVVVLNINGREFKLVVETSTSRKTSHIWPKTFLALRSVKKKYDGKTLFVRTLGRS